LVLLLVYDVEGEACRGLPTGSLVAIKI